MRLQKGLVSVIIPVHNGQKFIKKCLDSVCNQSYRDIEVIVTEDSSTDDSWGTLIQYVPLSRLEPLNFHPIRIPGKMGSPKGPSHGRNIALKNATGEYVFFLDIDDWLDQFAIERLVKEMEGVEQPDVVFSNYYKAIVDKNEVIPNNTLPCKSILCPQDISHLAMDYLKSPNKFLLFSHSWGKLFKREIIEYDNLRFDESLHSFEDVDFNFRYFKSNDCHKAVYIPEVTYFHLMRGNYVSTSFSVETDPSKLFGFQTALKRIRDYIEYVNGVDRIELHKAYGNCLITLTIIQLIRTCGQLNVFNQNKICSYIDWMIRSSEIDEAMKSYKIKQGYSKIIPWLIRRKWSYLLMKFCQRKAKKRYG